MFVDIEGQSHLPIAGHTSPETAYVVDDYPYGFRLRCKIRYWIEFNAKHGFRFVSQTTNPKKEVFLKDGQHVWNKPKAGTYQRFGMVMLKGDKNGYISHTGIGIYADAAELRAWFDRFGAFLSPEGQEHAREWLKVKEAYEAKSKAKGGE